jgi:hypothetical protein
MTTLTSTVPAVSRRSRLFAVLGLALVGLAAFVLSLLIARPYVGHPAHQWIVGVGIAAGWAFCLAALYRLWRRR